MKYHGYICYNSLDVIKAESLFNLLSGSGLRMFFDQHLTTPGQSVDKILNGLNESQSLLLLISKNGISEKWQKYELDTFLTSFHIQDSKRKIFIIQLEECNEETFPIGIKGFERFKIFDTNNKYGEVLYKLSQELRPTEELYKTFYLERPLLKNMYKDGLLKPTIKWYQDNAELFFETWRNQLPESALYDFIHTVKANTHNEKALILDAGCGPGHHSNFLSKFNFSVIGLDVTPNAIVIANKNKVSNTSFKCGDFRNLEIVFENQRNIFDGIWAAGSLVHTNSEVLALQLYQFIAVLKPNGILGATFQIGFDSEISNDGRFFERYKNETCVEKILESVGFKIISTKIDYDGLSTTKKKIKVWCCIIAKAPAIKKVLNNKSIF